jgi:N-acetyl-alpha-D-muramate 1-phosphate uridylyltransferase
MAVHPIGSGGGWMQVVILAGGLGTRLWPLTKEVPKPMVRVAGQPYLEHQLRVLARQGLTDILILTSYLGEQIEEYFQDGRGLGLSIRYSREPEPLGTGGAFREARHLLEDLFIVIYGDSYLPMDYAAVGRYLANSEALGVLVLYRDVGRETGVRGNVALQENHVVSRYDKTVDDISLQYIEAGVSALRKEAIDLLPPSGKASLEQEVFPQLIQRGLLLGFPTEQRFYDIGTPDRLQAIEALFA